MPSAAIEVMTVGTPRAILWLTLPLTPAPKRMGATEIRACPKIGLTSGTYAQDLNSWRGELENFRSWIRADNLKHGLRDSLMDPRKITWRKEDCIVV